MIVKGNFSVECKKCGNVVDFPANEADFDLSGSDERQMGIENTYSWNSSYECECKNEIEFDYEVWEYPVGAFNNDEVTITGGSETSRYDYDFHDEPEDEDE